METTIALTNKQNIALYNNQEPMWNRYHLFAGIGLGGGFIAGCFGLLLTVIAWFGATESYSAMHTFGTLLVVITIPLFILGAHSLDTLDRVTKEHRFQQKTKN